MNYCIGLIWRRQKTGPITRPIHMFNKHREKALQLTAMASRLLQLRRLSRLLLKPPSSNFRPSSYLLLEASRPLHLPDTGHGPLYSTASRSFCSSPPFNLNEGPAAIDYRYFPIFHTDRKVQIFLNIKVEIV